MLTISKMTGNDQPQQIRYKIKLGLRQYTVAFDIQELEEGGESKLQWSEATFDLGKPTYSQLVAAIVQSRYPNDDMQAIINNHLLEDGDAEHEAEWDAMQAWRVEAKAKAKEILEEL
jgi:hypothetical protein|uniref:Phage protein n=1 Tax=Siphoviridae sp. ctAUQ2 TaxID=2826182 RepID=A0A8S5MYX4_9CAUD|nr:MAG TPA: hypothetical protein [Siphoviridae sp. ctAUQ2]